jgi:hypothetical protein
MYLWRFALQGLFGVQGKPQQEVFFPGIIISMAVERSEFP